MGVVEQQEQLGVVARRFASVAPAGWVRLLGSWEATPGPGGGVTLNWITAAVVDAGDRWAYGQVGFDDELYDAVVRLNDLAAQDGPDRRWTTFDLTLDADGTFHVDLGYDPPRRSQGVLDEQSHGRFERYLDTWVAEHGPVPPRGGTP